MAVGLVTAPVIAHIRNISTRVNTQNRPKRDNRLVHRLLVPDQGVGGSNPLSPTIRLKE
jgi:hypothetical protein